MATRKGVDRKVEELVALRATGKTPEAVKLLRGALADRNAYVVSKAASVSGFLLCQELTPEMAAAFFRFLEDSKADPQCLAKNAIARALYDLDQDAPEVFLAGARHTQFEPVWGGTADSAGPLREICAGALLGCASLPDLEALRAFTALLADAEHTVRAAAARALGQFPREASALLLRLKIFSGDSHAEVIGDCFASILRIEPKESVAIVGKYLGSERDGIATQAIAALGESHEPEAVVLLKQCVEQAVSRDIRRAALLALGATRRPDAVQFLLERIAADEWAEEAIEALAPLRSSEQVRRQAEEAVRPHKRKVLMEILKRSFS